MAFKEGYALVIGVGSHKNGARFDVPITVRDAQAVYDILIDKKKCGYSTKQVTLLHDNGATKQGILDALDDLAKRAGPDKTVTVFYAGHGAKGSDDQYYLVSHDAQFFDAGNKIILKPGTGVSEAELMEKLKAIKSKRLLWIFNACQSGELQPEALGEKSLKKPKKTEKTLESLSLPDETAGALLSTGEGRIIMSACRPDQLSQFLKSSQLTFFAKALTEGLNGEAPPHKGFVNAFGLYTYVYDAVTEAANEHNRMQEPMITVLRGVGSFAIALYGGSEVKSLGLDEDEAEERLPKGKGVQWVKKSDSARWMKQIVVKGDLVKGDKVMGDKIEKRIKANVVVEGNLNMKDGTFVGGNMTTRKRD
jgi:hypothetical protein